VWWFTGTWEKLWQTPTVPVQILGTTSDSVYWLLYWDRYQRNQLVHFDGQVAETYFDLNNQVNGVKAFWLRGDVPLWKDLLQYWEYPEPCPGDLGSEGCNPVAAPATLELAEPYLTQLGPVDNPSVFYDEANSAATPGLLLGTPDGWLDGIPDPGPLDGVLGGVWPNLWRQVDNDVLRWDGVDWSTSNIEAPDGEDVLGMTLLDDTETVGVLTDGTVGTCRPFARSDAGVAP
jgi:hypothetical protein